MTKRIALAWWLFLCLAISGFAAGPSVRVLIVDGYSNHDWQLTTKLIRGILEPTGLFDVSVSTAPPTKDAPGWDTWRPKFSDYDVVIQTCNDLGGRPAWPRAVQEDFEAYVRNGGGVYVWHAGNNAFADWPAYNEMIGLGWRKKDFGWALAIGADEQIIRIPAGEGRDTGHGARLDTVVHRLGDHPIHAGLPRAWLTPDIEVYYHARGPAQNLEVLSYGYDPQTKQQWPLEWTVAYGQGRVYTSTFGHVWPGDTQPERLRCAGLQTVVVRALQWLAGRPADFPVPPDFPTAEKTSVRGEIPLPPPAEAGWTDLLAGGSTDAWRAVSAETFPAQGWNLRDGVLTLQRAATPGARAGGDIITRARYGNFELELEFRLTPGSNSGIKFHVQRDWAAADGTTGPAIGPEFQLLDDETHPDARAGRDGNRKTGSLYDLIPAGEKISRPIGEWNQARIVARGSQVEFWLNGKKTLGYDRHSAAFRELVAQSKYRDIPDFAAWPEGHILLQDHGDEVSFRNVRVRKLASAARSPDRNFHVFLCLGQSNMEGYPGIPEEEKAYAEPRFQVLAAVDFPALGRAQGRWYPAVPPLCRPNSGMSPADYFGRALAAALPASAKVGVVNVSVGGCKIDLFEPAAFPGYVATAPAWMKGALAAYGGNPYQRLVEMARLAQQSGVIRGILLHQGESNVGDLAWPAKVKSVYEHLLADLGLSATDVPLLVGGLVAADQQGKCASMNAVIADLPRTIPTAHFVSSDGCAAMPDKLHFSPAGYRELGQRYARVMLPLLGVAPAGAK